jgi:type II secretory pathway component GspD/PulD (secretin)
VTIPQPKKIFTFNNESLADIFKEISADYQVRFIYDQARLKDMSFTGRFNSGKETLADFLGTIAILNNLAIKRDKNIIYISQ